MVHAERTIFVLLSRAHRSLAEDRHASFSQVPCCRLRPTGEVVSGKRFSRQRTKILSQVGDAVGLRAEHEQRLKVAREVKGGPAEGGDGRDALIRMSTLQDDVIPERPVDAAEHVRFLGMAMVDVWTLAAPRTAIKSAAAGENGGWSEIRSNDPPPSIHRNKALISD